MQNTLIKALFGMLLATTLLLAGCGQKEKAGRLARLQKADAKVMALHELKFLYRNIYSGTLLWIYIQTDNDSKNALRNNIQVEYLAMKDQWQRNYDVKEDVGFADMDTLIDLATNAMGTLMTFEDYENDLRRAEGVALGERATVVFDALELRYDAILTKQDSLFGAQAAGIDDAAVKAIVDRHKKMISYYEIQDLTWEIRTRTLNWIYRPEDLRSKAALNKNIDVELQALLPPIRQRLGLEEEYSAMASMLIARLDTLVTFSHSSVIHNLQSKESYEDPLTMLLSEDAFETYINPAYQSATQHLTLIRNHIQNPATPSAGEPNSSRTMEEEMDALRRIVAEQEARIKELEEENQKLRSGDQ
jgi:hypothetical protein